MSTFNLFSGIFCNSGAEANKLNELIISVKTNLVRVTKPIFPGLKYT